MTTDSPYQDKSSVWSSHSLIARQIEALALQSRILDVGTASGMLARMCQNRSHRFYGVEMNEAWAGMALPFYEEIRIGSIVDIDDEFITGYDVVVMADILEHLPEPRAVLQKLVNAQPSGSLYIISVPNIANFWIRLNLLFGRFDYTDRGILDRTHLHFFTRKTLLAMIKSTGLNVQSVQVTPIPLELVSGFFMTMPGRWIHALWAIFTKAFPTLLGYQFVVGARKP